MISSVVSFLLLMQLFHFNFARQLTGKTWLPVQNNHIINDILYSPLRINCTEPTCKGDLSPIYCFGDILTTSYLFGLQDQCPGSKMRFTAREIVKNFNKLKYPITKTEFIEFCKDNFDSVPYLRNASLPDFKTRPTFFAVIQNKEHLRLAQSLHVLWNKLSRQFLDDVRFNTSFYPVVAVNNTFIVPGGRFQIFFYWDSYWILKGLLLSELYHTAEGMIENFAAIINKTGFIPNSGSIQLSRRSQPPLFVQMVKDYVSATDDIESLRKWIPSMDREMEFWITKRKINVELPSKKTASVFLYRTETNCPRPENVLSDYYLGMNSTDPLRTWQALATACESGWDFSTRWFDHEGARQYTKVSIRTQTVVPVDVNVFMALNFKFLSDSHSILGNNSMSAFYLKMYDKLVHDIDSLFWSSKEGSWFDYDLLTNQLRTDFYPSNVFPLLLIEMKEHSDSVYDYLERINIYRYPGGIPSTLPVKSAEQWDFPNVWAPTQHLFIVSLLSTRHPGLRQRAIGEAYKFINTVHDGVFNPEEGTPSGIWEKYDARSSRGKPGGGGEYVVQEGFGWTNGAIMDLINMVNREAISARSAESLISRSSSVLIIIVGISLMVAAWYVVSATYGYAWSVTQKPERCGEPSTRLLLEDSDNSDD